MGIDQLSPRSATRFASGGGWSGTPPEVAILGAGFGGMGMAIQLQEAGIHSFTIYEKSDGVGGTWRDNTYPGAACDAPSHLYSFSFAPNPDWSRQFAPQAEILEYLERCADDRGLRSHLRLHTAIASARFDEVEGRWHLRSTDGDEFTADVVVSGLGQLNRPSIPDLPGLDTFAGTTFHSARWNHEHALGGARVAVIGNAASAVQFVPKIATEVDHLDVFQRSPNWVLPKPDMAFTPRWKWAFRSVPGFRAAYRALIYGLLESRFLAFRYNERCGPTFEASAKKHLSRQVADPELRAKLLPTYPIGCNRMLISDDYYPALTRDNVDLVTSAIDRIEPEGIVTDDGELHPVDTIIFATGFESTKFLYPLEICGRDGRRLDEAWADGAEAYFGTLVSGFPNLFLLYGPNTNLGHNSIVFMIEQQVRYILSCLRATHARGAQWIDVDKAIQDAHNAELQHQLAESVWAAGCSSWYRTESGKIVNNWPDFTFRFWWDLRRPRLEAFTFGSARRDAPLSVGAS